MRETSPSRERILTIANQNLHVYRTFQMDYEQSKNA